MNKLCFLKCAFINNQHFAFLHRSKTENAEAYKRGEAITENVKTEIPKITLLVPRFFASEKKEVNDVSTNCFLKNSIGVTNAAITV